MVSDPDMHFTAIRKSSAPEMVAEQILRKITDGELMPGSRLPSQRDLAQVLGVGRSSVREAINALMVMGYLEPLQGKGTFIKKVLPVSDRRMEKLNMILSAGSILDLMEARELLECRSAALAAERADSVQVTELKGTIRKITITGKEYATFLDADIRFHETVAKASGNGVLCELTKLVLEKVAAHHKFLKTDLLPPAYRNLSIETAAHVVDAIEAGNADAAARWMGLHLNAIRDELKEIL